MSAPKYPEVVVQLSGVDGNAFSIIGRVRRKMDLAGVPKAEVDDFTVEATSGDYDNVLQTCMKWVTVK